MAFISSESTKFIQAIYKTYSDRNTLLNELVYGKQMIYYDLSLESPASIWLYLH